MAIDRAQQNWPTDETYRIDTNEEQRMQTRKALRAVLAELNADGEDEIEMLRRTR